jgi:hypothetical protein
MEGPSTAIQSAADAAGLDFTVLNEGIAYAFSPGITGDNERSDGLIDELVRFQLRGTARSGPYLQFFEVAAVIRPLFRGALAHNETIKVFLPEATAKWRSIKPQ